MNLAFPALLILLLVLPGVIFRYAYARGSWGWSSPVSFRTTTDEFGYGIVWAVLLHVPWLLGAQYLFGYRVDVGALLALLSGNFGPNNVAYASTVRSLDEHLGEISAYFITLYLGCAGLGRGLHRLIRKFKLDVKTEVLRFKNEWHYVLTGEILSFKDGAAESREIDGVFLSAVVDQGKDSYLYRGIVDDWSFNKDGELDLIRLRLAHRRPLQDDLKALGSRTVPGTHRPPDLRYYSLHGDVFLLRYAHAKTIVLDYFSLKEVPSSKEAEDPPAANQPADVRVTE